MNMDFLKNKSRMRKLRNFLTWSGLIIIMVFVYVIANGGNFSNFIEQFKLSLTFIGIVGIWWVVAFLSVSSMAIDRATYEVETEDADIKKLRGDKATLNNELEWNYAEEATIIHNDETHDQMQLTENKQAIRILKVKLYKVSDVLKAKKVNKRLDKVTDKLLLPLPENRFKKACVFLINLVRKIRQIRLKSRKKFYASKGNIQTLLDKYENGELNARFKFTPIATKQYTSIALDRYNNRSGNYRLKSNAKRKRFIFIAAKALITNTITTAGMFMAFKEFVDFNLAEEWIGLTIFLTIFIASLILKYITQYLGWLKEYPTDIKEVLTNIKHLLKKAITHQTLRKKEIADVKQVTESVELDKDTSLKDSQVSEE